MSAPGAAPRPATTASASRPEPPRRVHPTPGRRWAWARRGPAPRGVRPGGVGNSRMRRAASPRPRPDTPARRPVSSRGQSRRGTPPGDHPFGSVDDAERAETRKSLSHPSGPPALRRTGIRTVIRSRRHRFPSRNSHRPDWIGNTNGLGRPAHPDSVNRPCGRSVNRCGIAPARAESGEAERAPPRFPPSPPSGLGRSGVPAEFARG